MILDTNAIMVPEQFGVDIFSELERLGYLEWLIPSPVIVELQHLAVKAKKGRDKLSAKVGLKLAERCRIIEETESNADSAIENLAQVEEAAVFTNDKALKKELFNKGITVVYLRQGRYLMTTKKEF